MISVALSVGDAREASAQEGGTAHAHSFQTLAHGRGREVADTVQTKCGFPVLTAAIRSREELPREETSALAVLASRPELQTSVLVGDFRFHFDTTGSDAPALLDAQHQRIPGSARAFVDSAASAMAYISATETGALGFDPPPADGGIGGGPEYDIYVQDLGFTYGFTMPDVFTPDGGTSSSYIAIDNDFAFVTPDSNKGVPALRVTLAHEYHHASQIGRYGYWTNDVWYYELASVWMEDVVYSGVNDYYNYLRASWSHFRNPERSFVVNDLIMYSRGIWGLFFSKVFGSDAMRRTWEEIRSLPPLPAIDRALRRGYTTDFRHAFAEWCKWNGSTGTRSDPVRYYPEGAEYPPIKETMVELSGTLRQVTDSLEYVSSKYYRIAAGADTLPLILVHFGAESAGRFAKSPFTFGVSRIRIDGNYRQTASGLFLNLMVDDAGEWAAWASGNEWLVNDQASIRKAEEGKSYPSPYDPGGGAVVWLPADAVEGTVSIYTAAMELVYSAYQRSSGKFRNIPSFEWNGKTNGGALVRSGIYLFILDLPGKTVTGKIAVVRR